MIVDINKELKTGDLIIVAGHGVLFLGFYLGRGQGNTVQFYTFSSILWWYDSMKGGKDYPYKDYISGGNVEYRVARYDVELIPEGKLKEECYKCIEILKSLEIIKV